MKQSNSAGIPPFKPIPPAPEQPNIPQMTSANVSKIMTKSSTDVLPIVMGIAVPKFNKMPPSVSQETISPVKLNNFSVMMPYVNQETSASDKTNSFALRTLAIQDNNGFPQPLPQTSSNSLHPVIGASNVTETDVDSAGMEKEYSNKIPVTTTSFTPKYGMIGKVMNAPKEYYPVGYDKNFDDNFSSRVDLPDTTFHCGDQKHFPGLYADEDLGCMVSNFFHIIAQNYL